MSRGEKMSKIKKIFTNFRVILVIIALVLTLIAIHPNPWADGLAIRSVVKNSSAAIAGIQSPSATTPPMSREVIKSINNKPITSMKDYYDFVNVLEANRTFTVKTTKSIYRLTTKPLYKVTILNETEIRTVTEEVFDPELNQTINKTSNITIQKTLREIIGVEDIGLGVYDAPTTNIRKGLDLSGGSRVVLKPVDQNITQEDYDFTIENIKERLNVFGISDVTVRAATDSPINGNKFIIVEIAGVTKEEITSLLANQGKFESKIDNETVFRGGKDITYVCRSSECSGIDTRQGCGQLASGEWSCRFRFSIAITPDAAQRQANVTKDLAVVVENDQNYLSKSIDLFLDDELVDSLKIGAELKGNAQTEISISGGGTGTTEQAAITDALKNMKKLQTVLITGSLPVKLEIVKSDSVSPSLGDSFLKNALLIGVLSTIAVAFVVFLRYRKFVVSIPMLIIMITEMLIMIGVAALIGWNLDVAAIAGIIISIGTGVNDQIVIADETLSGGSRVRYSSWKDKIKSAFFIVLTAYFTIVVAMLPLWFAGAGLLKGFALTTIIGVSVGVIITRPAYAKIVEILCAQEN
jgi:preprotein translocase subunit SecD